MPHIDSTKRKKNESTYSHRCMHYYNFPHVDILIYKYYVANVQHIMYELNMLVCWRFCAEIRLEYLQLHNADGSSFCRSVFIHAVCFLLSFHISPVHKFMCVHLLQLLLNGFYSVWQRTKSRERVETTWTLSEQGGGKEIPIWERTAKNKRTTHWNVRFQSQTPERKCDFSLQFWNSMYHMKHLKRTACSVHIVKATKKLKAIRNTARVKNIGSIFSFHSLGFNHSIWFMQIGFDQLSKRWSKITDFSIILSLDVDFGSSQSPYCIDACLRTESLSVVLTKMFEMIVYLHMPSDAH